MKQLLSFEQAPPIDVPLRFMLTAVPFGVLAGLLLSFSGGALDSRWTPASLALTHLVTTGFMLQAMAGALLQLTPVAIGANVPHPRRVAAVVHPSLLAGSLALVGAFLSSSGAAYLAAATLLGLGIGTLALVELVALSRAPVRNPSRTTLRIALLGLIVTALLGTALALYRSAVPVPPELVKTATHLRFGWLGWGLLLLAGASYLVVPMFQLTPQYPAAFQRFFAPAMLLGLVLSGALELTGLSDLPLIGLAAGYALVTLDLQRRRRRPRVDVSFRFWQVALLCALLAALLGVLLAFRGGDPRLEVLLGICVLLGGFVSVINAMIYKIVPFLTWLHLNNAGAPAPLMHQVIDEKDMAWHFRLHLAALTLALATPWFSPVAVPAGLLLAAAHLVQGRNLIRALRLYRRQLKLRPAVPA